MLDNKPIDSDPSRSEGVLSYTITNVSKFTGTCLSSPVCIRSLQWRIMITLKKNTNLSGYNFMGFYLQCGGDAENPAWSCYAKAELMLLSRNLALPHVCKKIDHLFQGNENDWGFANFKLWSEVLDPDNGFMTDDSITVEAHVEADIPHGVNWDSKKFTGYIGLRNQGATCYMNSLLQTLFFTNQFRKAVYRIPFKGMESVAFALQRVFYGLQCSDTPVDTRILTNSFGWKTSDTLRQQDVHEFLRLLIDKLEAMIENTPMKGTFSYLFEGEMVSTVECKYVDYKSSRTETFYDIQLNVIGKNNILDSLTDYVAPEILEGDNKYDAGHYGLQEAKKKVLFSKFPPVLYLHLLRFHYDPVRDCSVKCNSRVEFPEQLNLDGYMLSPDSSSVVYCLHSVLVHSGNNRDGHYVVYINPEMQGNWYIFDDDVVCRCSKREAINGNFGGEGSLTDERDDGVWRHYRNAYVLVYIQQSQLDCILQKVAPTDIHVDVMTKILNKAKLEELFCKDNTDYTAVHIVLEDSFEGHEGKDLFDPKTVHYIRFDIPKATMLKDFLEGLSEFFKFPREQMRIWPVKEDYRPVFLNTENRSVRLQVRNISGFTNPWIIFLELLPPDAELSSLPLFDSKKHVLVFFKMKLRNTKKIIYCGHHYVSTSSSAIDIMEILNEKACYPKNTLWKIYLEVSRKMFGEYTTSKEIILQTGDIMVFQQFDDSSGKENLKEEFFKKLYFPINITLCDLSDPRRLGFDMKTYSNISYDDFILDVSTKLETEPSKLELFVPERGEDPPGNHLDNTNFSLKNLYPGQGETKNKKLYYKRLTVTMPLDDKQPTKRLRESVNFEKKKLCEKIDEV